jgi:hypothetical protein
MMLEMQVNFLFDVNLLVHGGMFEVTSSEGGTM